jgi:hypothetical protein
MGVNIAVFGAFVLMVAVLGFFLWQTLFVFEKHSNTQPEAKPSYSDQRAGDENSGRVSPAPSRGNATDEAIAEYTKWLAIFTLFLVLATVGLFISGERNVEVARQAANAARQSADLASEALIANTRAWLAPSFAILNTPLESGPPISFQLHMINTGKEPALNAKWDFKYYLIPYIKPTNSPSDTLGPNTVCEGVEPANSAGIVIYPATPTTNFWLPLEIPDTPEDRKIVTAALERSNSLVIEGCIAYRIFGKTHKSWFRFFLRDVQGQPSFVMRDGKPAPNWNFNAMTTGNGAN